MGKISRKIVKIIMLIISRLKLGMFLGKIKTVKKLEKLIMKSVRPEFVILGGHTIYLDEEDSLRLSINGLKYKEELEREIYKKHIKSGDVVIDVGAFIGDNTLDFARLVGEDGKVYAFEPNLKNFELLKKNIEINNYKNVILINKAVSDKEGEVKMYSHPFKSTGDVIDNLGTISIDAIDLDSVIKGRVDFLKIDVEGTEQQAIKGAQRILKENPNLKMILEIHPSKLKNPIDYLTSFINSGYKIYNLDKVFKEINKEGIDDFLKEYKDNSSNIFLTKC